MLHPTANLFQVRGCNRPPPSPMPNTSAIVRTLTRHEHISTPHTRGAIIHSRWYSETGGVREGSKREQGWGGALPIGNEVPFRGNPWSGLMGNFVRCGSGAPKTSGAFGAFLIPLVTIVTFITKGNIPSSCTVLYDLLGPRRTSLYEQASQ
ncbi:hypothetical protein FIBSPDRAFT_1004814 [Athelia psychrophila]|uniref:Uncharacterized protein n=1 Tax=Athelia psychrophila TaxID=1759441 RepID=A0A166PNQ6_9AGAM|nr:hypothetical protein FIBSPDRAFT_1004814 [Fibularhizoctonia sp. CBS 109695]